MYEFDIDLGSIMNKFYWYNEPEVSYVNNQMIIRTQPFTEFWQRTCFDVQKDNGHSLLTRVHGDFIFAAHIIYYPMAPRDQCGIIARFNHHYWLSLGVEYSMEEETQVKSIVTNKGFSDCAYGLMAEDVNRMWFSVRKINCDYILEVSLDGVIWKRVRITHLHSDENYINVGIYASSPEDSSFKVIVDSIMLKEVADY